MGFNFFNINLTNLKIPLQTSFSIFERLRILKYLSKQSIHENRFILKHIIHLLRYFEILSLSKIENDVCKGIFKLVKSMLKKLKPIFCQKHSY